MTLKSAFIMGVTVVAAFLIVGFPLKAIAYTTSDVNPHWVARGAARVNSNLPEMVIYYYRDADKAHYHLRKAEFYRTHRLLWQAEREYLLALRYPLEADYKASIYTDLGILCASMKRHQRAQAYYHKALKLDPVKVDYYHNWLCALQKVMGPEEMETALQDWLEDEPESIVPRYALSLFYERADRKLETMRAIDALIAEFPYSPLADVARLRRENLKESLQMLANPPRYHIE